MSAYGGRASRPLRRASAYAFTHAVGAATGFPVGTHPQRGRAQPYPHQHHRVTGDIVMTQPKVIASSAGRDTDAAMNLRVGGVCIVIGAIVFATVRLMHGDTPAAHAEAALDFVASRPTYAAVHLFAVLAAFVALVGLVSLSHSLTRPSAWLLGRAGLASFAVGLAVFTIDSTSEGLALPELAEEASRAAPGERAELIGVAHAVAAAAHGPSLVGMALLFGVPLALFGLAIARDGYPRWLGWSGAATGGVTLIAAAALFLSPTLFPGALLYGGLASVIAQLWLLATGIVMLRRSARLRDRG